MFSNISLEGTYSLHLQELMYFFIGANLARKTKQTHPIILVPCINPAEVYAYPYHSNQPFTLSGSPTSIITQAMARHPGPSTTGFKSQPLTLFLPHLSALWVSTGFSNRGANCPHSGLGTRRSHAVWSYLSFIIMLSLHFFPTSFYHYYRVWRNILTILIYIFILDIKE